MEITQADLRIGDYATQFIRNPSANENNRNESWTIGDSRVDKVKTKNDTKLTKDDSVGSGSTNEDSFYSEDPDCPEPNLNSIQHEISESSNNTLTDSMYVGSLDGDNFNEELNNRMNNATEIFIKNVDNSEGIYNISTIVVPSDILELSLSIKKEAENFHTEWISQDDERRENLCDKLLRVGTKTKKRNNTRSAKKFNNDSTEITKNRCCTSRQRLRKKAECMKERRKKLDEKEESGEEKVDKLSKETSSKRREMKLYYETPEKRRKRLDNEAAKKREYRMYETPDEKRKRLDREAERRRITRLTIYANETEEERRERLKRESAKRRESRLNQYAKETSIEKQRRLEKDATRAREMRFTRSAIESDEERRKRLVKDALRKRELRMNNVGDRARSITELQTVRDFEELNNAQIREQESQDEDNQFGDHYISNWRMWFKNTINQSGNNDTEPHNAA